MNERRTPAEQMLDAIADLERTADPAVRARLGHQLQDTIRASAPRVRSITDAAVRQQRAAGVPLEQIAADLGVSVQRVSQMATGKHSGKRRIDPPMIYAFRLVDVPEAPWHGAPLALPEGEFATGQIDFAPQVSNDFAGRRLEVRYGPVPDDGLHPALQAYTTVNGRRIRVTAVVQKLLFAPDGPQPGAEAGR